ncbi:amino acid/amide ABC transporter membrane protein 1 (HAAT family) [Branchiibius hedensis]|uniref:Amino acid/amide ABC transporter membrane protein 1, HAAT family n=1 Tax=Branchiibius hedensis TaxID=672460 RepID=A0A2Y8ZX57_9MICO|nr:branched-chain amino acid ABC transporter permease [Branchiibius hedensis]PWJ27067.1 amino acid/amide ABC transporter membrane protein 1 (HAAT family) [Branchiibius hedensis]SSA35878.1 amino acid/amide ABC transporter membrane protein 1, HAAT family [Branchiibius hedensis]
MTLVWAALSTGGIYALVAFGYNIVYMGYRTFNFAHAQLMMLGAFIAYTGLVSWTLPSVVVAVLVTVAVLVVAVVEERIAIRPLSDMHSALITTLGVSVLLTGVSELVWGSSPLTVPFAGGNDPVRVLGGQAYPVQFAIVIFAVLLVLAFEVITRRTTVGLSLMAITEDREAAMLRGINVRLLALGTFAVSGAVAGLSGMLIGPSTYAVATLGSSLALKGFVALALGGFGNMPGALVGGMTVGFVEAATIRYVGAEYANIAVFLVLVVVLMARPTGIFVRAQERTV